MAFQSVATHLNISLTFLCLLFFSRFLIFVGFLLCARLLGLRSLPAYIFFSVIIVASFLMSDASLAGNNGLFVGYFGHSEIGNGLFLISLAQAIERKPALAMAILGVIGFLNAFFAVWAALPLAAIFLLQAVRREIPFRALLGRVALGSLVAAAICSPVLFSIVKNSASLKANDFDYVAFLRSYFPFHFLFSSISTSEKIGLAAVAASSIIGFRMITARKENDSRGHFIAAAAGVIVVYCFGIVLPSLTHSISALNLHMMRSGGLMHLLCALATAALATQWWFDKDKASSCVKGPLLAAILAVPTFVPILNTHAPLYYPALTALFVFLVAASAPPALWTRLSDQGALSRGPAIRMAALLWIAFSIGIQAIVNFRFDGNQREWIASWEAVANWARSNTDVNSMFLIPVEPAKQNAVFEFDAHRAVWVDWKRGDAVMWAPSYYKEWYRRMAETNALGSLDDKVAYAKRNNIQYIVDTCNAGAPRPTERQDPIYRNEQLCVYDVGLDIKK